MQSKEKVAARCLKWPLRISRCDHTWIAGHYLVVYTTNREGVFSMNFERRCWLWISFSVGVLLTSTAPLSAQAPSAAPSTVVLTSLTIKADVDRTQVMKVMPDEVRATVKLYLEGKIQQWYSRSDGRGVVFVINCGTVEEAKALMGGLPLSKANLANYEFTALGPLTPLRMLLAEPPKAIPQP
jgi:hypothetical protein